MNRVWSLQKKDDRGANQMMSQGNHEVTSFYRLTDYKLRTLLVEVFPQLIRFWKPIRNHHEFEQNKVPIFLQWILEISKW